MPLERRNPLPAGRYWLDLPADTQPSFDAWRAANKASVRTETTSTDSTGWTWYLFRTTAPIAWRADVWGFPDVAGASVHNRSDVMQEPEPEPDFPDLLEGAAKKAGNGLLVGGAALLVAALVLNRVLR